MVIGNPPLMGRARWQDGRQNLPERWLDERKNLPARWLDGRDNETEDGEELYDNIQEPSGSGGQ